MAFKTGLLLHLLETSFVIHHFRNEKETHEESGPKLNWAKTPGTVTWNWPIADRRFPSNDPKKQLRVSFRHQSPLSFLNGLWATFALVNYYH